MRFVIYILIIISIIPVQTTLGNQIDIFGVKPDMGLVIVYLIGFFYGEVDGLIMGLLIGFIMDSLSPDLLGINFLTKSMIGLLAGHLGGVILNPLVNPVIIMALSLGCGILTLLALQMTIGTIVVVDAIIGIVVPQAIYDALIGFLICIILTDKLETGRFKGIAI